MGKPDNAKPAAAGGQNLNTTKSTGPLHDRPHARLPKGMRDVPAIEVRALEGMLVTIRRVYESYGFEPLDTPAFEYTDALGKFLPDLDRPNEGVFSFQDEDEQWLSLRYDLTAPLARHVAEHFDALPKPFRRFQSGSVYRNEKPGPGRFRQFMQFDADTVGAESVAADAELCMLAADTLEALGISRGQYVVKVNNRKVLDGIIENLGVDEATPSGPNRRLTVLRAIDKFDRLGLDGVAQLLGAGRKDVSGDFTRGANLPPAAIEKILSYLSASGASPDLTLEALSKAVGNSEMGTQGVGELRAIADLCAAAGFGADRIRVDPTVVRGLEYYTGPVFEAELTFEARNADGAVVRFGSVGGGGRYDDLVARFKGTRVPATGFSIGVSRLYAALQTLGKTTDTGVPGPVVVLVMDKERLPLYQKLARTLRDGGIRAEMYLGSSGMKAQMKYADKRGSPAVVIQGEDERARGEVTIKDLVAGTAAAQGISDNKAWREGRPAQIAVAEDKMIDAIREILARHRG